MSRFTESIVQAACSRKGIRVRTPDGGTSSCGWAEIRDRADALAGGLAADGVRAGDRIAVLVGDPAQVAPLLQAVWLSGAAVTLLQQPTFRTDSDAWLHGTDRMLRMLSPRLCVVGEPFLGVVPALNDLGVPTVAMGELVSGRSIRPAECAEDDLAVLQLSSGSTGTPKAVAVSHGAVYSHWSALTRSCAFDAETDTFVSWLPLFHDLGLFGFMAGPMQSGIDVVCTSPDQFAAAPAIWPELLTEVGGTVTAAPNFAYSILARTLAAAPPGTYDLSRLRLAVNGGEPIDPRTIRHLIDAGSRSRLSPAAVVGGYGMAEATLGVAGIQPGAAVQTESVDADQLEKGRAALAPPLGDCRRQELVVLGRPVPGVGVRVVDERGGRIPTCAVGEIQIRGSSVTRQYRTVDGWQMACDESGWLNTGDLGYLTDSGEVVLCGRKKDTIIIAGRNLFPSNIEWSADRVSGVRAGNSVAVGLTVDGREQYSMIVESKLFENDAEVERIRAEVSRRVFDDVGIGPRCVLVVAPGQLPKTSSGKIRRQAAVSMFRAALVESGGESL
ncbi:long-chain-fatty-acid--CoA ligase [Nocardia sp. Marseille-Q1738]